MKRYLSAIFAVVMILALLASCDVGSVSENPSDSNSVSSNSDPDVSSAVSGDGETSKPGDDPIQTNELKKYNVAAGMKYTLNREPHADYPDENGLELTDGAVDGVGKPASALWSGYNNGFTSVTIDLRESVSGLAKVGVTYLCETTWGIKPPSGITVEISDDGETFTKVGTVFGIEDRKLSGTVVTTDVKFDSYVQARYVKINLIYSSFIFLGEIQVYAYDDEIPTLTKSEPEYSGAPANITVPHAEYTFINISTTTSMSQEDWNDFCDELKNAGINGIITISSAHMPSMTEFSYSLYPSSNPAAKDVPTYDKQMEYMLNALSERGMKIYAGMNSGIGKTDEVIPNKALREKDAEIQLFVAKELYDLYAEKYPDTFEGFYLSHELNNKYYRQYADITVEYLNTLIDGLEECAPGKGLLISPFSHWWFGTASQLEPSLTDVFSRVHFREYDVYCPQDSVGAGLIQLSDSADYYKAVKNAKEASGSKVRLWANVESFNMTGNEDGDATTATTERYVAQMNAASEYVETITTFVYSSISPRFCGTDVFQNAYFAYLNKGEVPEYTAAGKPEVKIVSKGDEVMTVDILVPTGLYGVQNVNVVYGNTSFRYASELISYGDDECFLRGRIPVQSGVDTISVYAVDYVNERGEQTDYSL